MSGKVTIQIIMYYLLDLVKLYALVCKKYCFDYSALIEEAKQESRIL